MVTSSLGTHGDYSDKPLFGWLDWLPEGLRTRTLALLTTPRVWWAYRDELARLHLAADSLTAATGAIAAPGDATAGLTPAAWTAAVERLLTACHVRVVAQPDRRTGCLHYATVPLGAGDTQPTLETVADLQSASPLACALPPDLSVRDTQPMPAVTLPAPAQTAATPTSGSNGGPTFGWLRLSDLVDDAARAHVWTLLDAQFDGNPNSKSDVGLRVGVRVGVNAASVTPDAPPDAPPVDGEC